MKINYKQTLIACYIGYIVQAIVNTISPLLFVVYSDKLGISILEISILITYNFVIQIVMDLGSAVFVHKLGYRKSVVMAHILSSSGLILMSVLTTLMPWKFAAILIASTFMCAGGGLIEVIVSPIVEAIPGDAKASAMSILHSFYCWGQVAVVLLTTLYLSLLGIDNWIFLPALWALVPLLGFFLFLFVPINELPADEGGQKFSALSKQKGFFLMLIIMICAGASEVGIAQWASLFAEKGLGVSKTLGDLIGPCAFAVFMGIGRVLFGKVASKIKLEKWICASFGLCIIAYLIISLSSSPILSFFGFALCGLSVAILWPGTYSMGASFIPMGGTLMFALFALGGDSGCALGPDTIGIVSDAISKYGSGIFGNIIKGDAESVALKSGILTASIFPIIGFMTAFILVRKINKKDNDKKCEELDL